MFKNNISDVYYHKYTKIKSNSYNNLPLKNNNYVYNVIIFIKSVFNENHNNYYYKVVLLKC